jgi:hypothetical protein
MLVGEEGNTGGAVARVVDPVRSFRTYQEADDIARFQRLFAVWRSNRRRSGNHEEPLLIAQWK